MKIPRALIVEDVPNLAQLFTMALAEAGYRTTCLDTGAKARRYLAHEIPDLILLDLHLPFYSGDQLLADIRNSPRFANTRVIITTADTRRGDELRDKADLLLFKPISFIQLRDLSKRLTVIMPQLQTGYLPQLSDK